MTEIATIVIEAPGVVAVVLETEGLPVEVGQQGPPGPRGPAGPAGGAAVTVTAATALGGHRLVVLDGTGAARHASKDDLNHLFRVFGLTLGAAAQGAAVDVQRAGLVTEPSWAWDIALPVYLGADGLLTQTPPASGFLLIVGCPVTTTTLCIDIGDPVIL